jgi:hypothetical protein
MAPPAPIVCTLTPGQLRDRQASLLPGLAARATRIVPTDDGYRFVFAADDRAIVAAIADCIDAERHCCRFLRFTLTVPPEAAMIELDVTGPAGTRTFLDLLLA